MKKVIANIYSTSNGDTTNFLEVTKLLEDNGYEVAWNDYGKNAVVIADMVEGDVKWNQSK